MSNIQGTSTQCVQAKCINVGKSRDTQFLSKKEIPCPTSLMTLWAVPSTT